MINDREPMPYRYTRKLVVYSPENVDLIEFHVLAIPSEEMLAFNSNPAFKPVFTFSDGRTFFILLFSVTVMMSLPFNLFLPIEVILPSAYHIHII